MVEVTKLEFPYLYEYGERLAPVKRLPIGRDHQFETMESNLRRPEMNNVALLGPAGVGKTSFMEGYATIHKDEGLIVFDIDLPTMSGEGDNKFAERIKGLADDVLKYVNHRKEAGETGDTIIFLDEMHLITMSGNSGSGGGSAAGNALKPLMQRGLIKIVGATTDEEYDRYIKPDQALTRRFQTMNMPEPSDTVTASILETMAGVYLGKENVPYIVDPIVYAEIVDYTNRYLPSFAQPAKSIDILDAAIGFYRSARVAVDRKQRPKSDLTKYINHELIARIMNDKAGVDVDWQTDIETVMNHIKTSVMGQDAALRMIENRLFVANAGLQDYSRPLANFLFAGATGTGKTQLAKAMAESMFGSERFMIRYDMSEFSLSEDARVFQDRISSDISKSPYSVVLLDEMEKAHRSIVHLLLGILDDGRLTDQYGRQVTFTNSIIVVTTNGAADVFKDMRSQSLTVEDMDSMLRETLGNTFSPEFLGRFDEIIPFEPLREDTFENIARIELNKLTRQLGERFSINLTFHKRVADYLVKERFAALTNTAAGGGRAMNRRIAREVTPLVARVIDEGKRLDKSVAIIQISVNGEMAIENKRRAITDSHLTAHFVTRDRFKGELSEKMRRAEFTKVDVSTA